MIRYNNQSIIGVDTGNSNIKSATQLFTSGLAALESGDNKYADMMVYQDRHYALTQERIPKKDDKTDDDDFFILTLFAIAKELTKHRMTTGTFDIILSLGLPPAHLDSAPLVKANRDYFRRQQVKFRYNGRHYCLNISRVFMFPQGFAALTAPVMTVEMKRRTDEGEALAACCPLDLLLDLPIGNLIDIGGGTADPLTFRYGNLQKLPRGLPPKGILTAHDDIMKNVKIFTGEDIDEATINDLLNNKEVLNSEKDYEIVREQMQQYSSKLIKQLQEKEIPLTRGYNILAGGGAASIYKVWKERGGFGFVDYIPEIRANAIGYEVLANRVLHKQAV